MSRYRIIRASGSVLTQDDDPEKLIIDFLGEFDYLTSTQIGYLKDNIDNTEWGDSFEVHDTEYVLIDTQDPERLPFYDRLTKIAIEIQALQTDAYNDTKSWPDIDDLTVLFREMADETGWMESHC